MGQRMIDRLRRGAAWRIGSQGGWRRLLPFALLLLLAVAVGLPGLGPALRLASPNDGASAGFAATIDSLPQNGLVLVGMDADLGTYPEIRFATRAALAGLLRRGASLAFVSYSPEGRALAAAELERLRDEGVAPHRLLDLGYVAGAEAGLVLSVTSLVPPEATGSFADTLRSRGGGINAFDFALVVAGNDMGPRTWIEQVLTRLPHLPVAAIAPTFLRPELEPYLRSGQLTALLGTLRDGVGYGEQVTASTAPGDPTPSDRPPSALAMLVGMLIAIGVIVQADARTLASYLRRAWQRTAR
jgi:hypothetical protein